VDLRHDGFDRSTHRGESRTAAEPVAFPAVAEPRVFPQPTYQPPPGATELVLVRHGQSEAVVEGRDFPLVDGQGDPPLSELGRDQAKRVGRRLGGQPVDAIYVTTLCRTAQTAQPLADQLGLPLSVEPDLREVFLGEWEGGAFRQKVADRDPIAMQMFAEQRWDVIPGAEDSDTFAARVRGAIERIAAAHPDERVVVVSHGGTIGEILHQATGSEPWAFVGADNASISHIVVTDGVWRVRRYNDTSHLEDELTTVAEPLT
jgi:probable phosphoglycerate mutase